MYKSITVACALFVAVQTLQLKKEGWKEDGGEWVWDEELDDFVFVPAEDDS